MTDKNKEAEWFWLCSAPGLYEKDRKRLLREFETPWEIHRLAAAGTEISSVKGKKREQLLRWAQEPAEENYHKCLEGGINFISCQHADYPEQLLQISDPPSGLFFRGTLPRKGERCVAVIGARMCTYNGRNNAADLAAALAQNGVAVVSGMAYGIDARAQEACIEAGGRSFGVLGCGADVCYPKENRTLYEQLIQNGGVLSEYEPGALPLAAHFPQRNRIISGLSETVVVVEAKKKSGTLITADLALEQGRDVYAFPGRAQDVLSSGCNRLIQQGAGIITDLDEFLELIGCRAQQTRKEKNYHMGLASSENLLYSCLDSELKSLQSLANETKLPVKELIRMLTDLQIRGLAAEIGKNYYVRTR